LGDFVQIFRIETASVRVQLSITNRNRLCSRKNKVLNRVINHDGAAIFLPDKEDLVLTAGILIGAPFVGMRLSLTGQNPGVRCFKEKTLMIIPDVTDDPGWKAWDGGDLIRSWMGAPLLIGDKVIGVLTADSFKVRGYTEEDARILQIFAGQAAIAIENARLFDAEQHQRRLAESALTELKITQTQLIHQEKMASLGQLTAGIAHEIKNPLNFVNNFAAMSVELAHDLRGFIGKAVFDPSDLVEVTDIVNDLVFNAEQINEAGRHADRIIRSMLLHSRGKLGQRQKIDLNHLIDEAIHLTYHSMRAKNRDFNITMETDYDCTLQPMPIVPQDLSRVIVNLASNACDATQLKRLMTGSDYIPVLNVATRNLGEWVKINIRDNGMGMSPDTQSKIFQPFFTTKPAGQGTGLGLSISYEIITQGHRGIIEVSSQEGEFTEFVILLPKQIKQDNGSLNY
jgi:signal transduction histidine kinase